MMISAGFVLAAQMAKTPAPLVLSNGLVIARSGSVATRDYLLPTPQGTIQAGDEQIPTLTPAVTIRGSGITFDFKNAILRGTIATAEPDARKGLGLMIEGTNITIKNLRVHGYKVGLCARNCKGLRILNCDFSYNWKQHLASTPEKEDESDWQSYHHNDHNEWLRYGAGMYLEGCSGFEVKDTKVNGGQCGLMLVRSTGGGVWNNDFSFNSGVGLGLYRSSNNKVAYNKIDWCVRGFSYGVYNRGQDSAGILIFEQCNKNLFAFNSVTHGGDGFFLWAGQTMMDTGKGGCNGNILFGNDFSHSPCNAIEATFSRNAFLNNKLVECWHGVWGGYSFDTNIVANLFAYNGEGISIEHGQNNSIVGNRFLHENTAINLWQDPIADPNWTYLKHHDTVSRDYQISFNLFENSTGPAISVKDTKRVLVGGNTFTQCASAINQAGDNEGSQFDLGSIEPGPPQLKTITPGGQPISGTSDAVGAYLRRFDIPWTPFLPEARLRQGKKPLNDAERRFADAATWVRYNTWWSNDGARGALSPFGDKDAQSPFLKSGALRGQRYIFVDQWGPYDFKSPLLWPRQKLSTSPRGTIRRRFEILGPVGKWRLVSKAGVLALSHESGPVPGIVDIDFPAAEIVRTDVHLEYTGSETADYRGIVTPAGKPVRFDYHEFHVPIDWDVKFFKWDSATDPRTQDAAFRNLISGVPIKEVHLTKLDYAGGTFDREVGPDHFATICTGSFSVPAGKYTFELTTDDGARAWVDGKPVVTTAWKYQGPTLYTAKLSLDGSKHTIRVEHFQIDGYAALKVRITKG